MTEKISREKLFSMIDSSKKLVKYKTTYIYYDVSFNFLDLCKKYDFAVIGIDGFNITDKFTQPLDRFFGDFPYEGYYFYNSDEDWEIFKNKCYEDALDYLKYCMPELLKYDHFMLDFSPINKNRWCELYFK